MIFGIEIFCGALLTSTLLGVMGGPLKPEGSLISCPERNVITCIKCQCDSKGGYNRCTPAKKCPPPVSSFNEIRPFTAGVCKYGPQFDAQCTLCECSGKGGDHCAMCFALPVRRVGQSETLNKALPHPFNNRFFNYEVSGWSAPVDDLD